MFSFACIGVGLIGALCTAGLRQNLHAGVISCDLLNIPVGFEYGSEL